MQKLHIAALGSSFAAGPGIPPEIDRAARRSGQNYSHILAERLGAHLTDLTVSGSTLENLLSEPQVPWPWRIRFEPRLAALPADVDIVTITAGGNDINYVGSMMRDALASYPLGGLLASLLSRSNVEDPSHAVDLIAKRLMAVVDRIREQLPKCRILLVEYLTLLGQHTRPGLDVPLDDAQVRRHQNVANMLSDAYRLAAEGRDGCEVVPVASLSREHGLGSEDPWVEGFSIGTLLSGRAPLHPNAEGMRAVAGILYEKLRSDKITPVEEPVQQASK